MTRYAKAYAHDPDARDVVLLVEDDTDVRESMVHLLRLRGYHTLQAANGAEALDLLRTQPPPCLILLDLMMPVMDGWSFRRAVLEHPALAAIPVVLISGANDVAEAAERLRAVDYLVKPIDSRAVLDLVAAWC